MADDTNQVIFVNTVMGRGALNNIVNIQLGTFLFSPNADGSGVELDPVITCRLRMDRKCAEQLYETLGGLLVAIETAELEDDGDSGNNPSMLPENQ